MCKYKIRSYLHNNQNNFFFIFSKIIFFTFIVFNISFLAVSFSAYPDFNLDQIEGFGDEDEFNITGEACYNCDVSLFINNNLVTGTTIESDVKILDWESLGNTIELFPNQIFVVNYSPSSYDQGDTYNLTVFGEETTQNVGELSEEFIYSNASYEESQIIVNSGTDIFGGTSKNLRTDESLEEFSLGPITRDNFISGDNSIRVVVSGGDFGGSSPDLEEKFSLEIDKYKIKFNLDDSNVYAFNAEGGFITGSVENVDNFEEYAFSYLVNGPGEIINNEGLMRDFEVNESTNEFNISFSQVSGFKEGENTIDLIAHKVDDKKRFFGFERVNITRDTVVPTIDINSIKLYDGGNVVNEFSSSEIGSEIFTGYSKIEINLTSDAQNLKWEYESLQDQELVGTGDGRFPPLVLNAKKGDSLVEEISDDLSDGMSVEEIIEEKEFSESSVETVNSAYQKLLEEGVPRNSAWYEEVANEFLIGHSLIITATDEAGNIAKESFSIIYNDEDPELILEEMEPSSIFIDKESFNSIERIEGRTNQPNVDVSFIVIGPDDFVQTDSGNRQRVSCSNVFEYYDRGIWRNYEDSSNLDDDNSEDSEVSGSLALQFSDFLEVMRGSLDFTSDSQGNFGESNIVEAVVDGSFVSFRTGTDPEEQSAQHRNTLCAFMENSFGRTNMETFRVDYFTGNYDWDAKAPTFNKNSINPYEIESSVDRSTRYRASVVIEMEYQGQFGETGELEFNQVRVGKRGSEPRNVRVVQSEVVHYYENGVLNVYVPLEFSKRDIPVEDYPDKETVVLEVVPRATVEGYDIDTTNPEFVEFDINYDTNLMTKWLTPSMIDDGIEFLNDTLKLTGDARDFTRQLVPGGLVTCIAAKFWYSSKALLLDPDNNPDDREQLEELKQELYMVCDRTFCSAAPNKCDPESISNSDTLITPNDDGEFAVSDDLSVYDTHMEDDSNKVLERFTKLEVGKECVVPGGNGQKGRTLWGEVEKYDQLDYYFLELDESQSSKTLTGECVPYTYSEELDEELASCDELETASERNSCRDQAHTNEDFIEGIDTKTVRSSCYSDEAPRYDNTRCLGQAGLDPSEHIIDSLQCGCVPETYQHLNKLYKVQENIISCLEDVKSAKVEGTYCERLISVSMCDAVTGVVFRLAEQRQVNSPPGRDYDNNENAVLAAFSTLQSTDDLMDNRYSGQSFYSNGRINTRSIASNLCLFGLTGDFAMFEQSLMGDLETDIEVEPEFTKTMPQTTFESYNPINRDMAISYKFTHNGVSGGSRVDFKYELICDSAEENGEYCPEGRTRAVDIDPSTYQIKQASISSGSQAQELIEIRDTRAQYVFNVLKTTVEFSINGEEKTRVHEEVIRRGPGDVLGSGVFNECSFELDAGIASGGITCDSRFNAQSELTSYEFTSNTRAAPLNGDSAVVYAGEKLGLNVFYSIRGGVEDDHRGTLWYKSSCGSEFGQVQLDERLIKGSNGNFYVELFRVPDELGVVEIEPQEVTQENSEEGGDNVEEDVETQNRESIGFREGSCELELRMTGSDVQLTRETFEKDILEEQGTQVDDSTSSGMNQIYNTDFIVREELAQGRNHGVDLLSPRDDQTLCVDDSGIIENSEIIKISTYRSLENISAQLELNRFSQDPIEYNFISENNYENLYLAQHEEGSFSSVDFSTAQSGKIVLKDEDQTLDSKEVRLKIC